MTALMKSHIFNPFGSILIIGFLNRKVICNTDIVHEGTSMWLFHFFMNKTASAVVNARLSANGAVKKHSR